VQLFLRDELLDDLRTSGHQHGYLVCDVTASGTILARRRIGNGAIYAYEGLAIEGGSMESFRMPFLVVEPPNEPGPWFLGSGEGLRTPRRSLLREYLGISLPSGHQPYVSAALERPERELLLVGGSHAVLVSRRRNASRFQKQIWHHVTTTVIPPKLEGHGVNPLLSDRVFGIVGVGSVGSRVADLLAAAGARELHIFDPDTLELRNIRRHLCGIEHLGRPKVDAVRDELSRHGYPTTISTSMGRVQVDSPDENREEFALCDALVCCTESAAARQFVNHSAVSIRIPNIIADVQIRPEALAETIVSIPGRGGCFNCWRLELEANGLMKLSDRHDPADYPGPVSGTPSGLPMHQLTALAAATCDLTALALTPDAASVVQLTALDGPVPFFEDLTPRIPALQKLPARPKCEVCR
jgi:molybdopterin/thiamine biosynthesis adenylyltransferase